MARLIVTTPTGISPAHELGEAWITIGRGQTNILRIAESTVSDRHCEVKLNGNELVVRDLCSTNGLFIDGQKISEGIVKMGHAFWLGNAEVRLESSPAPAPHAAPPAVQNPPTAPVTPAMPDATEPVFSLRHRPLKAASVHAEKTVPTTPPPMVDEPPAKPAPEAEIDKVVFSLRQRPVKVSSVSTPPKKADKSRPIAAATPPSSPVRHESEATVFSLRQRPAIPAKHPVVPAQTRISHPATMPAPGEPARRESGKFVFSLRQRPAMSPPTPAAANYIPALPVPVAAPYSMLSAHQPEPTSAQPPPSRPGKYQVLFVDDSRAFLDSYATICGEFSDGKWEIHTCTSAEQALIFLQQHTMDLVVLDIGIPVVDGIQLLDIIHRRYPGTKIAMLTGLANESNRAICLANGAELFLEKPFSADGIRLVFNMLNALLTKTYQKGFSGTLQEVTVPDVIQLECGTRKSVILEVCNGCVSGRIYIESGAIIHATAGEISGEKAFQKLLALADGQFQLQPFAAPPERTISGAWEVLLMEAARVQDETCFTSAK